MQLCQLFIAKYLFWFSFTKRAMTFMQVILGGFDFNSALHCNTCLKHFHEDLIPQECVCPRCFFDFWEDITTVSEIIHNILQKEPTIVRLMMKKFQLCSKRSGENASSVHKVKCFCCHKVVVRKLQYVSVEKNRTILMFISHDDMVQKIYIYYLHNYSFSLLIVFTSSNNHSECTIDECLQT